MSNGAIDIMGKVVSGSSAEVLLRLGAPDIAAAIWTRQRDPGFTAWIDGLPVDALPACRVICAPAAARQVAEAACDAAALPGGPERAMLIDDIGALAQIFATVMQARNLRLRLQVVHDDACRKFHIDQVSARLLCTYRGAGTEYGRADPGDTPDRIEKMNTGDAAIFRGALWSSDGQSGIVHRSPPMARDSDPRFLLVLDADVEG